MYSLSYIIYTSLVVTIYINSVYYNIIAWLIEEKRLIRAIIFKPSKLITKLYIRGIKSNNI